MRFEEMKTNIPETPDFIHEMIQKEVEKQVSGTKMAAIHTRKKQKKVKAAFAAAACIAAVSTTVFVGARWYHMQLEQSGTYRVTTKIGTAEGAVDLPKELHAITFETAYLPDGMVWNDEYHLTYAETPWMGGFSFSSTVLDVKTADLVEDETGVIESEERTFGEYEGVYLQYQNGTFDKRIYLVCPDIYRVISIYIGEDVTKEDAIKVAENLSVVEKEETFRTADAYNWGQGKSLKDESDRGIVLAVNESELPIWSVGESFHLSVSAEDQTGNDVDTTISVSVDQVYVADDLEMLNADYVPESWKDALKEDGSLKDANLSYVKKGDGVETLDEVVGTGTAIQKLICTDVTYTNNTDMDLQHMLYSGTLIYLQQKDGLLEIWDEDASSDSAYDVIESDGVHSLASMEYYDTFEKYGNGGNYISSLKAGESVTVRMAWIIEEANLDKLYLNLTGEGAYNEISEEMMNTGLVDLSY